MKNSILFLVLGLLAGSCSVSKNFNPTTKYAPDVLQKDYAVFKNMLQAEHPGLYWYTPKDSMAFYFEEGKKRLHDSLTESGFRTVLSYVISKVRCGHTSVFPSKQWSRVADSLRVRPFPLSIKVWPDTAVITSNSNRRDSIATRGAVLLSIDGVPAQRIVDSLFQFLPADGYNLTHKYQTLSNRSTFGAAYMAVFGSKPQYNVEVLDTMGNIRTTTIPFPVPRDTSGRASGLRPPVMPTRRAQKKMALSLTRNLRLNAGLRMATMDLNSFTKDSHLRWFFKRSFKKLRQQKVEHLVIDLRGNGGGSVTNSNLLTRYISQKPFKIADSLYAVTRRSRYGRYQQNRLQNKLLLALMTRKRADGFYHFRYYEKHRFHPKRRNHFNGQVYLLTGGNTFSASTLFIQSVVQQPNVTVVGEETGGGAYGNNAWLIPDVTLPYTKVRFRLPLFRLVIDENATKGHGVAPKVPALPSVGAIRRGADYKTEKVLELIRSSNF